MRQTLCYIPETCYGIPVFGWGWGMGMLLFVIVLSHLYQYIKHRTLDDIGNSIAMLAIGGVIFVFVIPHLVEPGLGIPIRGYGCCLLIAILSAFALVVSLAKRQNIAADTIYSLCVWTVIAGIVGARLFYVIEYWEEMRQIDADGQFLLRETLFNLLNLTQGGLVVFGSILGGIAGALFFMTKNKMPMLQTFDIMAPAVVLGMSIGRIGCLLNGCCYGGITDVSWGITFPTGSPAHTHQVAHSDVFYYGLKFDEETIGRQKMLVISEVLPHSEADSFGLHSGMVLWNVSCKRDGETVLWEPRSRRYMAELLIHLRQTLPSEKIQFEFFTDSSRSEAVSHQFSTNATEVLPVHPTQIYSSILALLLCGTLLILGRLRFYRQRDGLVLASFMILYSVGRFLIEYVRTDEDSFFGTGLTVSQNVSIFFCLAGVALFVHLCRLKYIQTG